MTRVTGILRWYVFTFMIVSRSVRLRISNIPDKSCRESQNTTLCSLTFSENCAAYEIIVKNMVQPDRSKMTI